MTKAKQFLKKDKKKSKHAPTVPTTADEYLSAGVDFEEAGEKWRGGDAVKSTRFFIRAIDCYDEALKKFPTSFDLAYNKARVQYELTQHPKLLAQLPSNLVDLLETALESSRYALKLDPENAEVLFNTAQILTSIVEAYDEPHQGFDPLPYLEEALTIFQHCLSLQEIDAIQSQAQAEAASQEPLSDTEDGGVSLSDAASLTPTSPQEQEERWASIIEPVTNDTLLDTLVAQLDTLTLLCSFLPPSQLDSLSSIEEYAASILASKLTTYTTSTGRDLDATLAQSSFLCAFADIKFRSSQIDLPTYSSTLSSSYQIPSIESNPKALCDAADSYIAFNSSLRLSEHGQEKKVLDMRWKALSKAISNLTLASKLPDAENLAAIHLERGDVEILRWQLSRGPSPYPLAVQSANVLLNNAEKFYRGAKGNAAALGLQEQEMEGEMKECYARELKGDLSGFGKATMESRETNLLFLEMMQEGLVEDEQFQMMRRG